MKQFTTRFERFAVGSLIAATFAVFGFGAAALAQNAGSGDAANGKRVYLADGCFECHGRVGQGGAMNYPAPALAQVEMPIESFMAFLRNGPNDMPAYSASVGQGGSRYLRLSALAARAQAGQGFSAVEQLNAAGVCTGFACRRGRLKPPRRGASE
jgi:mono/diheme cytochrome c family protein